MPIRFACGCGQPIAARDEYAGRRVQCIRCKRVLTVPAPGAPQAPAAPRPQGAKTQLVLPAGPEARAEAAPPRRPAAAKTQLAPVGSTVIRQPGAAPATVLAAPVGVRFRCACGAQYQARPEHAGEPTHCPRCGDVLFIPAAGAARAAGRPAAASHDRADQYADPDAAAPRSARTRLLGALLVLLLLGGGGYGAWAFYFSGLTDRVKKQEASAFGLIPANATFFLAVRPAALLESKLPARLLRELDVGATEVRDLVDTVWTSRINLPRLGLRPAEVEEFVAVYTDEPPRDWLAVQTRNPVGEDRMRKALNTNTETRYQGKTLFVGPPVRFGSRTTLHFVHPRLFVLGPEGSVRAAITESRPSDGPLAPALRRTGGTALAVFAADAGDGTGASVTGLSALLHLRRATLVLEDRDGRLRLSVSAKAADPLQKGAVDSAFDLDVTADADRVAALILPSIRRLGAHTRAQNNMREITQALIRYAEANNGRLPPASLTDPNGRPLLSWRVAILPYLGPEAAELYKQFRLNEPWNSPHNRPLVARMPKVFEMPNVLVIREGTTYFQAFTGAKTAFPGREGLRYPAGLTDGTANTILVAAAAQPVYWAAPHDLQLTGQAAPLTLLGAFYGPHFLVGLADGTVKEVPQRIGATTLRAAVSPAGGDALGADWNP